MHGDAAGRGRRVLVVDDDPDVRRITATFLRRAGCEVAEADHAHRALALLDADPATGTLVTDFAMPGMNGAELVLRARAVHPGLPAMVVTGFADAEELACLPDDVTILRKPFRRDDLLRALDLL